MTSALPIALFAGLLAVVGVYLLWRERRAATWTVVTGQVIEVERQSLFERGLRTLYLNLDSDHVLRYRYDGTTYDHVIGDTAAIHLNGLKLWRRTPALTNRAILVNPSKPRQYFDPTHRGAWKLFLALSAVAGFGALWFAAV